MQTAALNEIMSGSAIDVVLRYLLPVLAIWVLARCVRSMLSEKPEPELWGFLVDSSGVKYPINHWECIIGRAKSADIVVPDEAVAQTHATLMRDDEGNWTVSDLGSKTGIKLNGEKIEGSALVKSGDKLQFSRRKYTFKALSESGLAKQEGKRTPAGYFIGPGMTLIILTLFQGFLALGIIQGSEAKYSLNILLAFTAAALLQWLCYLLMKLARRSGFEPETIAFFLSSLGIAVVSSSAPEELLKTMLALIIGVVGFFLLGWWLRNTTRTTSVRWLAAAVSVAVLAFNVLFSSEIFGAKNWIFIGGVSIQPAEFVKVAYIYTGAATLDRLFAKRNLLMFIAFSALCVIALTLMGDFGTAVIFFSTFLVIAFMRSGSFATLFLAVGGAGIAGFLVLTIKPYIAQRFATWGHVWEDVWGAGFQQTRAISAVASGGLFGKGAGSGTLKYVFAADTDMVFAMLSEELGIIVAVCAMLAVISLGLFAVKNAEMGRGTFFVIAGCAAACMMMVQMGLNVFGTLDILPFTGVTFPFVSKGGSSLIACWLMLAFVKATDTRRDASFIVRQPASPDLVAEGQGGGAAK